MAGLNRAYKRRPNAVALNGAPVLCLDAGSKVSYPGSGTTWTDLSGNANNGTLVNGPTFDSANGGSIVLNGTNQYSTTANATAINLADNFTIDCWFNPSLIGTGMVFCSKYASGFLGWLCNINAAGKISIDGRNGNGSVGYFSLNTTVTATVNTWYNFVVTISGVNLIPYVNGSVASFSYSSGGTGSALNGAGTFAVNAPLLAGQVINVSYFNGKISCCKLYNRVLSATEIATNFELLRGRYGI